MAGAVVEALAAAWGTSVEEVVSVSDFRDRTGKVVGDGDGQQVTLPADVVRNPLVC